MSNYNTQLQTNNSSLEEIIVQLNELPEAGGSNIETYDLILQSDGIVIPSLISYISYTDGQYQYHTDTISGLSYPATFTNVVLKTPLDYGHRGGNAPWVKILSNIDYVLAKDYTYSTNFSQDYYILPLTSDNGQVILRFYDDDP